MKYLFIVNPISGKREAPNRVLPLIESVIKPTGVDYEVVMTEYPGHAREIAKAAGESGEPTRICSCGGDGTFSEVASGAFGYDNLEVTIFPCGSGNDFIKCFEDTEAFRDISCVSDGEAVEMDVLRVNDRQCFNIVSVGFDADVNEEMNKLRRHKLLRGKISYNIAVIKCLMRPMGRKLYLDIDGVKREGTYMLSAFGNGRVYGGQFHATPEASIEDGLIDVVTVNKIPLSRIVPLIGKYTKGEHIIGGEVIDECKDCVLFCRAKKVSVTSDGEFVVNIDGEVFRADKLDVEVVPKAMRFVIPKKLAAKRECAASAV